MHIKINITAMRPNVLLHMLWPKTSLRNQQIHLELLWILIYTFMKKTSIYLETIFLTEIKSG
jgi:hypothetical protein